METVTADILKLLEEDDIPTITIDFKNLEGHKKLYYEHEELKKKYDNCYNTGKAFKNKLDAISNWILWPHNLFIKEKIIFTGRMNWDRKI
jgi:hypothetical protein